MSMKNVTPTPHESEAQAAKWSAIGRAIRWAAFLFALFLGLVMYLGWHVLQQTAPALMLFLELVFVVLVVGAVYGLYRYQKAWHEAKLERYRANTHRLTPVDFNGNYELIYNPVTGTLIHPTPGNYQQPVAQSLTYAPHVTGKAIDAPPEVPHIATPLVLPGKVLALDVMRTWNLTPQHLFLGLGKGSRELACTLEGLMHVAHDAPTGYGKSVQWMAEIIQLLKLGITVILCNPHFTPISKKGEDWRPIGRAIEVQGWIELQPGLQIPGLLRTHEHIAKLLKWLSRKELERRFAMQAQGDYSYTPLYLFIDEWPSIVARYPEAGDCLVDILQRGRAVDVCVDANAQGFLSEDVSLKGSARENFNTAYHMGGSAHSGAKLLDLPVKDYNEILRREQVALGKGIALLRNNEAVPHAELVRLPYAENNYVYYMLGRADSWELPEFRKRGNTAETDAETVPEDTTEQLGGRAFPVSSNEEDASVGGSAGVGNEIRETIKRMRKKNIPHREVAALVGLSGRNYHLYQQVCREEGIIVPVESERAESEEERI